MAVNAAMDAKNVRGATAASRASDARTALAVWIALIARTATTRRVYEALLASASNVRDSGSRARRLFLHFTAAFGCCVLSNK